MTNSRKSVIIGDGTEIPYETFYSKGYRIGDFFANTLFEGRRFAWSEDKKETGRRYNSFVDNVTTFAATTGLYLLFSPMIVRDITKAIFSKENYMNGVVRR